MIELTRPTRCAIIEPVGRLGFRLFLLRGVSCPSSCRQTHLHIPLCLLQNPSSWQRCMNQFFPQNRWVRKMALSNQARHTAVSDPSRRFGLPQTTPITILLHRISMRCWYIPSAIYGEVFGKGPRAVVWPDFAQDVSRAGCPVTREGIRAGQLGKEVV